MWECGVRSKKRVSHRVRVLEKGWEVGLCCHMLSCHVIFAAVFARSNSRTRESSRHGDSDWTTSGVDRCYSGNVGHLLDPGEP